MHDYFSGMICTRDGGTEMPDMIKNYTSKGIFWLYDVFRVCPASSGRRSFRLHPRRHCTATQVFGLSGSATDVWTWVIYGGIFAYYLIATVFPIDAIIGRIYPIFGAVLLFSALGIFIAIFAKGYPLTNVWDSWNVANGFAYGDYFTAGHFIPVFFVTVACGILSGFHSTQTSLISRTIKSEKEGRMTFYNMMVLEGFIAMVWAAGTMAMINLGSANGGVDMQQVDGAWKYMNAAGKAVSATSMVGVLCKNALGQIGGMVAIIGVIVLPITSGDTALRALRLMVADTFKLDQSTNGKRIRLAAPIFALCLAILIWAKADSNGFNILWRYFAWSNQTLALFALACIAIWMFKNNKAKFAWMPLMIGCFYAFVTFSFICQAKIGFHMSWTAAYICAAIFTIVYLVYTVMDGKKKAAALTQNK
jgi:carbon starvation protein CstA